MKIHRINAGVRWSDITVYNRTAYFVEVPDADLAADIRAQAEQVLGQAESSLARIGSNKNQLLSATIYLTDFDNLAGLNEVWDAWFDGNTAPSRACVNAQLADPRYLIEIAFVAVAGESFDFPETN
ncbi:MAG: RidA family protein [Pseudohongiella sp.]|nr:RidA family protein [Pseudohongiella sp.]MDO9519964.1 RidA family protein [Pseudohongiella sp.]MDP2127127.1 RidA family protein [Pseudohongiella sp.]